MRDSEHVSAGAAGAAGMITKSAPPVVVTGMTLAGYSISDWVYVATLVWLALQIGGWVWDRFVKGSGK
ncbi:MAG TPA: hypothetical protein VN030_13790 [Cellvibrio sp.]|nr:hypothetical protein [Cellvibrio sp.]